MRNKINEIQTLKGITFNELVDKSHLSRRTVAKIKKQELLESQTPFKSYVAIANALEVPVYELLDLEDTKDCENHIIKMRKKRVKKEMIAVLKKLAKAADLEIQVVDDE